MSKDINIFKTEAFKMNLATDQHPKNEVDKSKGIIKNNKNNKFSEYLLFLLNNHSEHGAIVRGKASYLSGLGITTDNESTLVQEFLARANPHESQHELDLKTDLDDVTFGGHYLKIETNALGQPLNFYHIEYNRVRLSDDFCGFRVCDDWNDPRSYKDAVYYPKYQEGVVGVFIQYIKKYTPSLNKIQGAYAQPEYTSCILDIDTDIRVGTFFNNYVKNNFSSGTMVTIFNGETDPLKKQAIVNELKAEHTGEDNAGNVVVAFAPKDGNPAQVLSLNAADLDKQYQEVSKRNKEKIVAGHGVTGVLFKVKTDDKALFSRSEIVEAHELFLNEYVKVRQAEKNKRRSKWCLLKTGQVATFDIEQVKLIGLELPLDNQAVVSALNAKNPQIITDYIIEKYAIKVPENKDANGQQLPVQEAQVNENIKNLTGRQFQGLMRIVTKYEKKAISRETAIAMMKSGFAITEEDAKTLLNIADEPSDVPAKLSRQIRDKQQDFFFELFNKYAHDISPDDEVLDVEFIGHKVNMADEGTPTNSELKNAILNQLKGNPYLSVRDLANNFKVEEKVIEEAIKWLDNKGLVNALEGTFQPTEKAMDKETDTLETEIYTEYTYGLRDDQKGTQLILPTTRDFCRRMVLLTRTKALSYDAITELKNELGDDAWSFRGGYFNDGSETTPWCRHVWLGTTKIRRRKK